MDQKQRNTTFFFFFLLALFALTWFAPMNFRYLIPTDEGRYAEMAREMFITGNWITPHYNGYIYFEKPPLQTWLNAFTFYLFGIGEWQARLYTAITSFLGIGVVWFTGQRLFSKQTGICAALVLFAAPYWVLMGHFNTLDMGLSFWMELTLCALLIAQHEHTEKTQRRYWMWLCWASMAMALLSKGLIAVLLPGAVLVIYTFWQRDWQLYKRLHLISGSLIFFALSLPWFILVQQRNPDFFHFFFIVQQFERYLTPAQNRPGPFYYFVPVLLVGFLPWLSVLPQSVRHAIRNRPATHQFSPNLILLIWTGFIFLFFSFSDSKLISYILPIAPAIALLIAQYLPQLTLPQIRKHLIGYLIFFVLAAIGSSFLRHLGNDRTPNALYQAFANWVLIAIACTFFLLLFSLWFSFRKKTHRIQLLILFSTSWLIFSTIGGSAHNIFGKESSGVLIAPAIKAALEKLPANTPFYSVGMLDHTLPFYIGHTMMMVAYQDELAFGISIDPKKWIPTYAQWIQEWNQKKYAMALMSPKQYQLFEQQGVPMTVVAQDARRVIVEKPLPR